MEYDNIPISDRVILVLKPNAEQIESFQSLLVSQNNGSKILWDFFSG